MHRKAQPGTAGQRRLARLRRHRRVRRKLRGTAERPRLAVFRSDKHIYAQIVDDIAGKTLAASSTRAKGFAAPEGPPVDVARAVGAALAIVSVERGIERVVFDAAGYRFHGRVKALAEGAQAGGLRFD